MTTCRQNDGALRPVSFLNLSFEFQTDSFCQPLSGIRDVATEALMMNGFAKILSAAGFLTLEALAAPVQLLEPYLTLEITGGPPCQNHPAAHRFHFQRPWPRPDLTG